MNEGVYYHQLDAKNRMRIPAKIREEFVNGYTLTLAPGGCLAVISREESERRSAMFAKISPYDPVALEAARSVSIWKWDAEEDNQGRILLPNSLLEYAGIEKNVVTVGVKNRLEIWSEERREALTSKKTFEEYMALLSARLS